MKNFFNKRFFFFLTAMFLASLSVSDLRVCSSDGSLEKIFLDRIAAQDTKNTLVPAKEDIRNLLKLNPAHEGGLFYAGKLFYEIGKQKEAELFLSRIRSSSPYSNQAKSFIADIRLKELSAKQLSSMKIYLKGGMFREGLKIAEEVLEKAPQMEDFIFNAAYAATMIGDKEKAFKYAAMHSRVSKSQSILEPFVAAMFSSREKERDKMRFLLNLKHPELKTSHVKKILKDLIIKQEATEEYFKFVQMESEENPGAAHELEDELLKYLIDREEFELASEIMKTRSRKTFEDHMYYAQIQAGRGFYMDALNTAQTVLREFETDIRSYSLWINLWLRLVQSSEFLKQISAKDNLYQDVADELLNRANYSALVTVSPEVLMDLYRLAVVRGRADKVSEAKEALKKVHFFKEHEESFSKLVTQLNRWGMYQDAYDSLENFVNQVPDAENARIELAYFYMASAPQVAAQMLEEVCSDNPYNQRAFLMWCDAASLSGRKDEAVRAIEEKLENSYLAAIAEEQLKNKLNLLNTDGITAEYYSIGSGFDTSGAYGAVVQEGFGETETAGNRPVSEPNESHEGGYYDSEGNYQNSYVEEETPYVDDSFGDCRIPEEEEEF
ncbi:MAG: hypothetical protein GX221_06910 [Candidatus Riflebacteria bacterium]|nr:hypothetical protein [Candidatus Riflebacteria bacterium]